MKRITSIFISSIFVFQLHAQEINRTLTTDSSVIKTTIYRSTDRVTKQFTYSSKNVEESYKKKNLVHIITTFQDTTIIAHDYYTKQNSTKWVGIFRSYYGDGRPKLTVDNDAGTWIPADTREYPNYAVLNKMKLKGDSIVRSFYGEYFFKKYVSWNIYSSYYFDSAYTSEPSFSIEWLRDDTRNKYTSATEFYISYNINYEDQLFENAIRIIIDRNGKLLPSHPWNMNWTIYNCGLENVNKSSDLSLITKSDAFVLAKQQGLKKEAHATVRCVLKWESKKEDEGQIINGRFVFSVTKNVPLTNKEKEKNVNVVHSTIWLFDPWTKKFIEKREENKAPFDLIFGSEHKKNTPLN